MKLIFVFFMFLSCLMVGSAQTTGIAPGDDFDINNPPEGMSDKQFYWTQYDAISMGAYRKGQKHGTFLYFRIIKSGVALLSVEETYSNGQLSGYYRNNTIPHGYEEGFYKAGLKDGLWLTSQDDVMEKAEYKKGVKHGKYERRTELLLLKGSYVRGQKHGIWTTYYIDGDNMREEKKEIYKRGKLIDS